VTDILVVTGLSGAGRSQAADDLEDLGWFVVDNLPVVLIDKVVELTGEAGGEIGKLCLVVGNARHQAAILESIDLLRTQGHTVRILFLEASTRELVRRYEATRRKHPMSDGVMGLESVIESERSAINQVKAAADLLIDTTGLSVHDLKRQMIQLFGPENAGDALQISLVSFGFKNGVPMDVDMVFDVRFLPNPHWNEDLRPLSGVDVAVKDFLHEGRSYLTIGVGCTGGRHRSVAISEELARLLTAEGRNPRVTHRDISL
jgi:UPF0042 nucleotide-binding protein